MKTDSNSITIRAAKLADTNDLRACATQAYQRYVKRIGKIPAPMKADFESLIAREVVDVALHDNVLTGYVVYFLLDRPGSEPCYFIENIAVRNSMSGRGTGTLMMKHVEDVARNNGVNTLSLYTNARMTENLLWYPKLGFEELDRRFEDGFDRVYFQKRLR